MLSKASIAFLLNPLPAPEQDQTDSFTPPSSPHTCRTPVIVSTPRPCLTFEPAATVKTSSRSLAAFNQPSAKKKDTVISPSKKARANRRIHTVIVQPASPSPSPSPFAATASSAPTGNDPQQAPLASSPTEKVRKPRRRRIRIRTPTPCTVADCENFAVTRGVCVKHGGGARCEHEGCEKRAKMHKRCFQHGGHRQCLHPDCSSKAKRYGYCWAHGGGISCAAPGCSKVRTQGGFCWAHGGGSRCRFGECSRRSYQKDDYYCSHHTHAQAHTPACSARDSTK